MTKVTSEGGAAKDTSRDPGSPPGANREPPRTPRGERTRARIVEAARVVFERDGYSDTRLGDITTEAGTASGSFYTYFASKEDVFAAVLDEVQEEMLHPQVRNVASADDPIALIEASNRAYFTMYEKNAKLMRLLEEVSNIDSRFREHRRKRYVAFVKKNARGIRELQIQGLVDPELDPTFTASALTCMVSRLAYATFVVGDDWDVDELVDGTTRIWANALRLTAPARGRRLT